MTTHKILSSLVLGCALFAAACGDSKSSLNPVAPSAVVVDGSQSDQSGGVITPTAKGGNGNGNSGGGKDNGNGNGNGGGNNGGGNNGGGNNGGGNQTPSVPPTTQPPTNTTPTTTRKVEIEGLISAKATGSITVNAQVIDVPSSAVIRHGSRMFTFADLHVNDRVHVKADRTTTGTGVTATTKIQANEVKLQLPGDEDDDPTNPPQGVLVSVRAIDATASETGVLDIGAYEFTRTGDTAAELTVTLAIGGTATNGVDYQGLPLTVTFNAGEATATFVLMPMLDSAADDGETAIVTVVDGTGYVAGSPASATVTISG